VCLTIDKQQSCYAIHPGKQDWHNDLQMLTENKGVLSDVSLKIIAKQSGTYQLNLGQLYIGSQLAKPGVLSSAGLLSVNHAETVGGKVYYHTLISIKPAASDLHNQARVYYQGIFKGATYANQFDLITAMPVQINSIALSAVNAEGLASDLEPV
jgi:hypothetical protein